MSTVAEITEALPRLNDTELQNVERALYAIYRQRHAGIIFDDAYGVFTEADQAALAAEAFGMMDAAERKAKDRAA